jgi:Virulence activator alpha C-term
LLLSFPGFFIIEMLLQFDDELVGILLQAILNDFSPVETQELHRLVLVGTSISTGSSNWEPRCYQRIPGPSLHDHLLDGKLDARKVGEQALEPFSDSFYSWRLAVYREIQERDFPDPQHLSYEQRLFYLPLLRGLMFEKENVAWCDTAIDLLQEGM